MRFSPKDENVPRSWLHPKPRARVSRVHGKRSFLAFRICVGGLEFNLAAVSGSLDLYDWTATASKVVQAVEPAKRSDLERGSQRTEITGKTQ